MSTSDFYIDPRNKYGDADWAEEGDDFNLFVDALNRGVSVRADGVPGESGAPADPRVDAAALGELRSIFSRYIGA